MDIFEEITKLKREGKRAALATIVNVRGSIPSIVAAKMLVREDGSILGTVGGGCVESDVRKGAMEVMRDEKPKTFNFNLDQRPDDDTGLVCGGSLEVFIEPVIPSPQLYIFGGGHIGLNVHKVAMLAGFETIISDDRDLYSNRERFPDAHEVHAGEMEELMAGLAPSDSSYIVIVTRGHRHDMQVLRWALDTPAHYIGMIGSSRQGARGLRAVGSAGSCRGEPEARLRPHRPRHWSGHTRGDRGCHCRGTHRCSASMCAGTPAFAESYPQRRVQARPLSA